MKMKDQDAQHLRHLAELRGMQLPEKAFSLSDKDYHFMCMALQEAAKSTILMPHGCVATLNGKVIARGFNTDRCQSSDGFLKHAWCSHAEITVVRKIIRTLAGTRTVHISNLSRMRRISSLSKITLYVARGSSSSSVYSSVEPSFKSSGPCSKCMPVLRSLNIKNIVFLTSDNRFIKCRPQDYTISHITTGNRFAMKCKLV
jgi:tRNA(Arg) A34 adenosine deaminase TadA